MAFASEFAPRIWEDLWRVYIPDSLTVNRLYLKKRGSFITDNRQVNEMMMTNKTLVMIPISKILEYFVQGIEIEIPNHEDMIKIHKTIENYLDEWKNHIQYDINVDYAQHKKMLSDFESLSKQIYNKAKPNEVVSSLFKPSNFGLVSNLAKTQEEQQEAVKPDYQGINRFMQERNQKKRF